MMIKLTGFRELEKALSELPRATAKNVLHRTAKKALEPMRSKAQGLAPRRSGKLQQSVVVSEQRTRRVKKEREPVSGLQMAMGPGSGTGALIYASFDEFGTVDAPAFPYMRPAWDGGAMGALEIIKTELGSEIAKAAGRLARKAAKG